MSAGDRAWAFGSPPLNMIFSPEASRWLFTILNGPGPLVPRMACESNPATWISET